MGWASQSIARPGAGVRALGMVILLAFVLTTVANSAAGPLGWWLRGWPWAPGEGLGLSGPNDQAVLAYQRQGPEPALAEADPSELGLDRDLAAGDPGDATGNGAGDIAVGGTDHPLASLSVVGPLTGDLAPKAPVAVLMEQHSGMVLYAKNEHERRPMASVTKIMTLCLVFDALESGRAARTDKVVTSARASGMGGSQIWLEVGETMTLHEMLIAIAVGSANDACVAVAEHISGTVERFVEAMNEKARELGMVNTSFVNPHGLDDPNHYSTAYDMALLSRYAATKDGLLAYTSTWIEYLRDGKTLQANHNDLVRHYPGCDGLKTGWTSSTGYCLAATAERDGSRFIAVVLGASTSAIRFSETRGLLNAAFATFRSVPLAKRGNLVANVPIERGTLESVDLAVLDDFGAVVAKGQDPDIQRHIVHEPRLFAPIKAGQVLAELVVEADGVEVGRTKLVAAKDVPRANVWQLMWKALSIVIRPR